MAVHAQKSKAAYLYFESGVLTAPNLTVNFEFYAALWGAVVGLSWKRPIREVAWLFPSRVFIPSPSFLYVKSSVEVNYP